MFLSKTICKIHKNDVLETTSFETYEMLLSLETDSNAKLLNILKEVNNMDSSDITEYVMSMQNTQKKLKDIDMNVEHHEMKPSAHMNTLLENFSEEQTKEIHFYRKERRVDREKATKSDLRNTTFLIY